jgi:hypothetical protein
MDNIYLQTIKNLTEICESHVSENQKLKAKIEELEALLKEKKDKPKKEKKETKPKKEKKTKPKKEEIIYESDSESESEEEDDNQTEEEDDKSQCFKKAQKKANANKKQSVKSVEEIKTMGNPNNVKCPKKSIMILGKEFL